MRVLCVNCGSSSLKYEVLDVPPQAGNALTLVAGGVVDRIGSEATGRLSIGGSSIQKKADTSGHSQAMSLAIDLLDAERLLTGLGAVGHRVVHGGPLFQEPVLIDEGVIRAIDSLSELAPLHNLPALEAIRATRTRLGEDMPMVATFDTSFYRSLPEVASLYAIPRKLSETHSIRRYGFHGLAHRYMVERFQEIRPEVQNPRLITLQLGNGCSATASVDGKPIDTSMGFTPLEGLIMGTRSGDVDPSLPLYLAEKEGLSNTEVASLLNTRSGLLGLSGRSGDMRDLLAAAAAGDTRCEVAIESFCYRVKKYLGAYLAALGGIHAVIFGGGIGESSPEVRRRVCGGMEWAGLKLDQERNASVAGGEARISDTPAEVEIWVVPVKESQGIAEDVVACLELGNAPP